VPQTEHGGAEGYECDALVVGSGAAGMSAAITAAHGGLKVVIAEKESVFATEFSLAKSFPEIHPDRAARRREVWKDDVVADDNRRDHNDGSQQDHRGHRQPSPPGEITGASVKRCHVPNGSC